MAKNRINCTLVAEDKVFVDEKKNSIEYVACTLLIGGEEIRVSVKKEDKSLFNYLRRSMDEAE